MLLDRINAYIATRAINPRTVTRSQHRQMGNMVPISEVQIIVAMVMAGNIENFLNCYDHLVTFNLRTQQVPNNFPNDEPKMQNPPPPPEEIKVVELDLSKP